MFTTSPRTLAGLALCGALIAAQPAFADALPDKKKTRLGLYVTATEAAAMLGDSNVLLVDVRSRAEVTLVGHPARVDVHIPFMVFPPDAAYDPDKGDYRMVQNPDFADAFIGYTEDMGISPDATIILMCRSGNRSARAADMLADAGFSNVFSMIDGFEGDKDDTGQRSVNGWRNAGFEWSYSLNMEQVYPDDLF